MNELQNDLAPRVIASYMVPSYPGQWTVSRGSYSTSASLGLHAFSAVPYQAATYGGPGPADCWAASPHGPRGLS